ncbi:hypothetical protein P692DRAFT_20883298 [Suillus brevipes Sb2]|nr:hypothetical protein P692DRAFT_20883298 [Suillus brevipes Sb2]
MNASGHGMDRKWVIERDARAESVKNKMKISYTINAFPAFPMPPRKRAKHSAPAAAPSRRSERSTRGVGGHVAQLQKTGETLAAPARKGRKEPIVQMSDSDAEENPMAPSQLQRTKKKNVMLIFLTATS